MSQNAPAAAPFQREDRYIVIKRSDLKKVPVNYRSHLIEPMFSLLAHLPRRECLVIESDWPEFEPAWAAIEARVSGAPAAQRLIQLQQDRTKRVYIAGPMTGLPDFNFPVFNAAAATMRGQGWHVENPAEHGHVEDAEWGDYLRYDIGRLATCEAVMLLPGWAKSRGACLEVSIARQLDMPIMLAEGAEEFEQPQYPACDYCGITPDHHPWHGSGLLNGVESRHIHACDGCRSKLPAEQYQGEPVDLNSLRATGISQVASGWNKCIDRLQDQIGHLYTHADPAEVERLRSAIEQQKNLIESLRAELVESNSIDATAEPCAPELTDDLREILGRPNFTCHFIAKALRVMGHSIASKSEDEQAVVIHWLLDI